MLARSSVEFSTASVLFEGHSAFPMASRGEEWLHVKEERPDFGGPDWSDGGDCGLSDEEPGAVWHSRLLSHSSEVGMPHSPSKDGSEPSSFELWDSLPESFK